VSEPRTLTWQELYERIWKDPMTKAVAEFGLSDRGLARFCDRNAIPVPPRDIGPERAFALRHKRKSSIGENCSWGQRVREPGHRTATMNSARSYTLAARCTAVPPPVRTSAPARDKVDLF